MRVATILIGLFLSALPGQAWGTTAHRLIHERAIASLPGSPLKRFLIAHESYVVSNAVLPDRWRPNDPLEGPRHYIDLEFYGGAAFAKSAPETAPAKADYHWGTVPWQIDISYQRLVAALRERRSRDALREFAVLGHYVTDAHVPLHSTQNHDGQLTGDRGVHSRWESRLVEFMADELRAMPVPPPTAPRKRVLKEAWRYVLQANAYIPALLSHDRKARRADSECGDGYLFAMRELERDRIRERLNASAKDLAGLWIAAWKAAGRPELDDQLFVDVSMEDGEITEANSAYFWKASWEDIGTQPFSGAKLEITVTEGNTVVHSVTLPVTDTQRTATGPLPKKPSGTTRIRAVLLVPNDSEQGNNETTIRPH